MSAAARTQAEMVAGRKRVSQHSHDEDISLLRKAGLVTTILDDPLMLAFHKELARAAGALPVPKPRRLCRKCFSVHDPEAACGF